MDRLRHLIALGVLALAACVDNTEQTAVSGRFDAVRAAPRPATAAAAQFCDTVLPPSGPDARRYVPPPERPIPGYTPPSSKDGAWRWVNLWATWCKPCVEEMALLGRWKAMLAKDGHPVEVELVSLDEDGPALAEWLHHPLPGRVHWLRGNDDLLPLLQSLGLGEGSAIPIHALVDPAGQLRCVRVGSVRERDYAAIATMVGQN